MPPDTLRCPHCGAYDVSADDSTCVCAYCGTTFSLIELHKTSPIKAPDKPLMVCVACGAAYADELWAQCVEADVSPHKTQTTSSWSVRCTSFRCPSCGGPICRECVSKGRWGGNTCKRCGSRIRTIDGAFVVREKKEIPLMLRRYLRS